MTTPNRRRRGATPPTSVTNSTAPMNHSIPLNMPIAEPVDSPSSTTATPHPSRVGVHLVVNETDEPGSASHPAAVVPPSPSSIAPAISLKPAPGIAASIDLRGAPADDAASLILPPFQPLRPPPPDQHHPEAMNKLARMRENNKQARTETENRYLSIKYRVLTSLFAASVILLPLVAFAFQSTVNGGTETTPTTPSSLSRAGAPPSSAKASHN